MLRNENHWTDLVLFFQSHKYPLQFTILAHSINYSVFVSINDPFNVQHVPYHSSHSLQNDICRIAHSFSYYQSTILMSIYKTNHIVVAILICLVVCWTWIDTSIQNRHRFNPSIIHSWDKNNSKWLDERMIEYTISL